MTRRSAFSESRTVAKPTVEVQGYAPSPGFHSSGMSVEEIEETYGQFPREAIPEVMRVAAEILDAPNVAA